MIMNIMCEGTSALLEMMDVFCESVLSADVYARYLKLLIMIKLWSFACLCHFGDLDPLSCWTSGDNKYCHTFPFWWCHLNASLLFFLYHLFGYIPFLCIYHFFAWYCWNFLGISAWNVSEVYIILADECTSGVRLFLKNQHLSSWNTILCVIFIWIYFCLFVFDPNIAILVDWVLNINIFAQLLCSWYISVCFHCTSVGLLVGDFLSFCSHSFATVNFAEFSWDRKVWQFRLGLRDGIVFKVWKDDLAVLTTMCQICD